MADKPKLVTPPPVQVNARRIVAAGTALFALGFVVLLFFYDWLGRHHHRIWLWTCLAGAVLGVIGYLQMLRHKRMGRTV
jgi:hypothetical protein